MHLLAIPVIPAVLLLASAAGSGFHWLGTHLSQDLEDAPTMHLSFPCTLGGACVERLEGDHKRLLG